MEPDSAFIPNPPVSWESIFSLTAVILLLIASLAGGGFWLWRKYQSQTSLIAVRQGSAPETVVGVLSLPSSYLVPASSNPSSGSPTSPSSVTKPPSGLKTTSAPVTAKLAATPKAAATKTAAPVAGHTTNQSAKTSQTSSPTVTEPPAEDDIWADTGLEDSIYAKLADSYYENPGAAEPSITDTALTGLAATRSIVKPNASAFAALKLSQAVTP